MTPNGKMDKKALPDPELTRHAADIRSAAERNRTALADIWQELLGIEQIGIYDNFFELGGHSLLAMRVVSAIRQGIGCRVKLSGTCLYIPP